MIWFIIGLFVGANVSLITYAIFSINKDKKSLTEASKCELEDQDTGLKKQ